MVGQVFRLSMLSLAKSTLQLSLTLAVPSVALAQPNLYSVKIRPYELQVPEDHLVSNALYRDLQLHSQNKFRIYGEDGFLAVILRLNPHVNRFDDVTTGTRLVVPIPVDLLTSLPSYWRPLSPPGDGQDWRLYLCCEDDIAATWRQVLAQSDAESQMVAKANGLHDNLLGLWERSAVMLPEMQGALRAGHDSGESAGHDRGESEASVIPSERSERRGSPEIPDALRAGHDSGESAGHDRGVQQSPPPLTAEQEQIINAPEQHELAVLTDLPSEALEKLERDNPEVLAEKLTEEKIKTLDEKVIAKLPPKTVENKAWQYSFLDSFKPGMNNLFKNMKTSAAGVYVGTRIGFSLISPEEKLLSQVQVVGLLAEVRSGFMRGMRLYWDYVPDVTAQVEGKRQSIAWNRALFGWSFELPVTQQFAIHMAPQIGSYSVQASLPVANVPATEQTPQEFNQNNAISGGIYLDAEYRAFFYILRVWASSDRGLPAVNDKEEAVTSRFGFDGFLKGAGFTVGGKTIAPSYLIFTSLDYLSLRGSSADGQQFNLEFFIPYLGTGISLSW